MRCKRGLCCHAVSVCPSVCLSVTFVDHVKTNKHIFEIFSPSGSDTILVFPSQRGCRYSDGNPPNLPSFRTLGHQRTVAPISCDRVRTHGWTPWWRLIECRRRSAWSRSDVDDSSFILSGTEIKYVSAVKYLGICVVAAKCFKLSITPLEG